CLQFENYPRTF
nr:immunoglobulin light chain junction region [Macaca mulatta]MOW41579.1 immunoglobulin light chain junction region [Macaca mulatta]